MASGEKKEWSVSMLDCCGEPLCGACEPVRVAAPCLHLRRCLSPGFPCLGKRLNCVLVVTCADNAQCFHPESLSIIILIQCVMFCLLMIPVCSLLSCFPRHVGLFCLHLFLRRRSVSGRSWKMYVPNIYGNSVHGRGRSCGGSRPLTPPPLPCRRLQTFRPPRPQPPPFFRVLYSCLWVGCYVFCCTCCAAGDVASRVGGEYWCVSLSPLAISELFPNLRFIPLSMS